MAIGISMEGTEQLERKLEKKSKLDLQEVQKKQLREIFARGQTQGGTPVDSGELRISERYTGEEVGYTKDYGPHVEFGHRTISGNFVPGQYYFKKAVEPQKEIYKQDLKNKLKE